MSASLPELKQNPALARDSRVFQPPSHYRHSANNYAKLRPIQALWRRWCCWVVPDRRLHPNEIQPLHWSFRHHAGPVSRVFNPNPIRVAIKNRGHSGNECGVVRYSTHNPVGTAINRQGPFEKPWPSRRHLIHNAVGAGNECGVPGYTTQNPVGAAINRQGPLDRNCGHSGNECGVAGYSTHNPVGAVINQQGPNPAMNAGGILDPALGRRRYQSTGPI
ncbi:hypothetical protein B0H14DRAFT_2622733 [Mycena olivaceomarginata]|nr:hypothetical protein B0H14DRAFT_2622733 [Mycena olivaceomarginata]